MQNFSKKNTYQAYLLSCMFRDVDEMIDFGILEKEEHTKKLVERGVLPWYHRENVIRGDSQYEPN